MKSAVSNDTKLQVLLKKEAAIRAAISQQKVRTQKRQEKDDARLCMIVGTALIAHGMKSQEFKTMLKQVLTSAVTEEGSRRFLGDRGWL